MMRALISFRIELKVSLLNNRLLKVIIYISEGRLNFYSDVKLVNRGSTVLYIPSFDR